ncbi:hypothetical protein G7Y89_g10770 [Cudoniella acicularis]|uniref:Uncharacterized protein n=1 Tax=Cudoniella acicularis TaxID=354080 RepID=A0A8H4RD68_9HELO|nr:hypothetical protein G7Y89_g10770 [Cudoniella acicularis]
MQLQTTISILSLLAFGVSALPTPGTNVDKAQVKARGEADEAWRFSTNTDKAQIQARSAEDEVWTFSLPPVPFPTRLSPPRLTNHPSIGTDAKTQARAEADEAWTAIFGTGKRAEAVAEEEDNKWSFRLTDFKPQQENKQHYLHHPEPQTPDHPHPQPQNLKLNYFLILSMLTSLLTNQVSEVQVTASLTAFTALLYLIPFAFVWDTILFILWIALFEIFGKISDDNRRSSEDKQGYLSTRMNTLWLDLDEQRLLAYKKEDKSWTGSLASPQAGLGPQYARAGTLSGPEAIRLPPRR